MKLLTPDRSDVIQRSDLIELSAAEAAPAQLSFAWLTVGAPLLVAAVALFYVVSGISYLTAGLVLLLSGVVALDGLWAHAADAQEA